MLRVLPCDTDSASLNLIPLVLILVMLWLMPASGQAQQHCREGLPAKPVWLDDTLLFDPAWKDIAIFCTSTDTTLFPAKHATDMGSREAISVDLLTGSSRLFFRDVLEGVVFQQSLIHELTHVVQYRQWMGAPDGENSARRHLETIHQFTRRDTLNGAWQTLALLRKQPKYKKAAKNWLRAYATVFFCMEFHAWHNEARYALENNVPATLRTPEATAVQQQNWRLLARYINRATVQGLYPEGFSDRELAQALEICQALDDPVALFKAAAVSLELTL